MSFEKAIRTPRRSNNGRGLSGLAAAYGFRRSTIAHRLTKGMTLQGALSVKGRLPFKWKVNQRCRRLDEKIDFYSYGGDGIGAFFEAALARRQ
jgi:hypothetical protein